MESASKALALNLLLRVILPAYHRDLQLNQPKGSHVDGRRNCDSIAKPFCKGWLAHTKYSQAALFLVACEKMRWL